MDKKEKSIKLHLDKAIGYSDKAHDELQIALNIALDGKGLSNEKKRLLSVDFATGQEEAKEQLSDDLLTVRFCQMARNNLDRALKKLED